MIIILIQMIKREVIHRADVKTVYSSEKQERMKVYFELQQKYEECLEPCKLQPAEYQQECKKDCEKIFDQYVEILKPKYEDNKERLDMEVTGSRIFTTRKRKDRSGWFFDLMGVTFREYVGLPTEYAP